MYRYSFSEVRFLSSPQRKINIFFIPIFSAQLLQIYTKIIFFEKLFSKQSFCNLYLIVQTGPLILKCTLTSPNAYSKFGISSTLLSTQEKKNFGTMVVHIQYELNGYKLPRKDKFLAI